jgi:hypothetical protein
LCREVWIIRSEAKNDEFFIVRSSYRGVLVDLWVNVISKKDSSKAGSDGIEEKELILY